MAARKKSDKAGDKGGKAKKEPAAESRERSGKKSSHEKAASKKAAKSKAAKKKSAKKQGAKAKAAKKKASKKAAKSSRKRDARQAEPVPPQRFHRAEPERTRPLRSGASARERESSTHEPWERPPGREPVDHPLKRASDALANELGGTVGMAVDLGYRVIEEQIRQGRDLAEQLGHGSYDRSPWEHPSAGLRGVTPTTMLASLWFDLLGNLVRRLQEMGVGEMGGGFSLESAPLPWHRQSGEARAAPPGRSAAMSVEVDSKRPIEVSVTLGRFGLQQRLATHLINTRDPAAPALADVVFDHAGDTDGAEALHPRVRIRVDDALAAGLYTGAVIDCDTGRHVGSLTVRVAGQEA